MFQISTMANFKQNFLDFWSFFTRPRDNDEAGPHVVQAHDSAVSLTIFNFSHDNTPTLMVFREISFWNEMFLCLIKTEMFTFAES